MSDPTCPRPPLVAILRGLEAERAVDVARVLFDAGFRIVEVPLNRPGAIDGIAAIVRSAPADALVGGGTMLTPADVDAVHAAGGRMMVSPNCNPAVIAQARQRGMFAAPGVATPTEAFAALEAGASVLKLFPAEVIGPAGLKATASVPPASTGLWPVVRITPRARPRGALRRDRLRHRQPALPAGHGAGGHRPHGAGLRRRLGRHALIRAPGSLRPGSAAALGRPPAAGRTSDRSRCAAVRPRSRRRTRAAGRPGACRRRSASRAASRAG